MLLCENVANIRLIVVFATMFLLAPAWADYKVVTYNILSENYLSYGEYDKLPVDVIAWSYRKPRIVAKLLSEDADIIQLQEVEKTSFDDLVQELLPHGYMAVAAYNPPLLSKDFVATFFKEAVFELKSFHIGVYPGRTKTFLDLTLMDKKTQKIFSAINTKLKGGDPTKGPSATGLKQLGILQAYLAEKKTPYLLEWGL